jgi:hypothetical protein
MWESAKVHTKVGKPFKCTQMHPKAWKIAQKHAEVSKKE